MDQTSLSLFDWLGEQNLCIVRSPGKYQTISGIPFWLTREQVNELEKQWATYWFDRETNRHMGNIGRTILPVRKSNE